MTDDTISRQAAIDALERKKDKNAKGDIGGFYNKIIQNDIDALIQLPTAQSGWKRGRWLTSDDMYETGVCSVCKCDSQEPVSYAIMMFKYCPNCGARMESKE